jgi:GNAT superfamily N-acetyltransferase
MSNNPSAGFRVRPAEIADVPAMLLLAKALAQSEGTLGAFTATEEDWRRDGFGPVRRFSAFLAEGAEGVVGMVTYTELYSTGLARSALYIIDFFVAAAHRRHGLGRKLLAHVAAAAKARGAVAVELGVQAHNPADKFYRRMGFRRVMSFMTIALTDPALSAQAKTVEDWLPLLTG